jgi:hypothetical protein
MEGERGYWAACRKAAYHKDKRDASQSFRPACAKPLRRSQGGTFLPRTPDDEKLLSPSLTCKVPLPLPIKDRNSKTSKIFLLDRHSRVFNPTLYFAQRLKHFIRSNRPVVHPFSYRIIDRAIKEISCHRRNIFSDPNRPIRS